MVTNMDNLLKSMRAHIQVKQIVRAVFDSINLILGRIIQVGSSYPDSNLAKQIMITYATVFSIPDFGDELFEVMGSKFHNKRLILTRNF